MCKECVELYSFVSKPKMSVPDIKHLGLIVIYLGGGGDICLLVQWQYVLSLDFAS